MTPDWEHLLRDLAPQVLGSIVRRYRDFAAAEDAVQEALLAAAMQWPHEGVPDHPRAWLTRVASRKLTDEVRSEVARRRREAAVQEMEAGYVNPVPDTTSLADEDDTLILIYLCCHPALTDASAIALTLRAVGGLTTAEIARAFLVPEATMAQRIHRAKQTIGELDLPFHLPDLREQAARIRAVLHVLSLIFNEGYTASEGEALQRADLANEGIRLARLVRARMPEHPEVAGLLALMLLTDARREARVGPLGEAIPLNEQDRTLWDRAKIMEGVALIGEALPQGALGPYQVQAAIAAVHDEAATPVETDWPQILALYRILLGMQDHPVVRLNHAVAVAMVHGPEAGLALVEALGGDARMRGNHRWFAVRGHLREKAGNRAGALEDYQAAAARTANLLERNYLLYQAARLRAETAG